MDRPSSRSDSCHSSKIRRWTVAWALASVAEPALEASKLLVVDWAVRLLVRSWVFWALHRAGRVFWTLHIGGSSEVAPAHLRVVNGRGAGVSG